MRNLEQTQQISHFWNHLPPTINMMVGNNNGNRIDLAERPEILGYLPSFDNQTVLDLPAGIGRFTGEFAKKAKKVVAVDISAPFIRKNKESNQAFENIDYICSDALEVCFEPSQFDLIFISWLFMYLEDPELEILIPRLVSWLKPNGHLFLRESCAIKRGKSQIENYFAIYRQMDEYPPLFDRFTLIREGSIQAYMNLHADPLKCFWLYQLK